MADIQKYGFRKSQRVFRRKQGDRKMKDEEMAEQFANGLLIAKGKDPVYRLGRYEGFLAGLKAGRTQWHKVADGDLPKENKLYFVAIKENGLAIAYFNGRHWETKYNLGDFGHCVETVIAWCEIPTFDKE